MRVAESRAGVLPRDLEDLDRGLWGEVLAGEGLLGEH